jgi:hypothetical protein
MLKAFLSNRITNWVFWFLVFFALSIIVRLPHFLSNSFWFDGDEAIVGIMAQDLLAGKSFPLYFYGQAYGLSIFEVGSVAFWIKLIGSGIWALRLGGLMLFALGATFVFKGLIARQQTLVVAFLITIAIICFPPWILWAGMVRGGYVTAFLAISALFCLSAELKMRFAYFALFGFILAVAFESHVFLLLPILPLLLKEFIDKKGNIKGLIFILSFAAAFVFLLRKLNFQQNYWGSPGLSLEFSMFPERFMIYVKGILNSFSGFYYYTADQAIPVWWSILLVLVLGLIAALIIKLFFSNTKRQKLFVLLSLMATVLIFFIALSMKSYTPRYLLSVYTAWFFIFLFFVREALQVPLIRNLAIGILSLFIIGLFAGSKLKRDWYESTENRQEEFHVLYQKVKTENFKSVFVCDNLMQWQWNYLYGQEIPANGFRSLERTMPFTIAVDSIYRANPKQTAIIGYWGIFYGIDYLPGFNDTRYQVERDYFIQPVVTKEFHDFGYKQMGEEYHP